MSLYRFNSTKIRVILIYLVDRASTMSPINSTAQTTRTTEDDSAPASVVETWASGRTGTAVSLLFFSSVFCDLAVLVVLVHLVKI